MSDDADKTAERDELEAPLRLAASKRPEGPLPTGKCLFCGDQVSKVVRWCNDECRDDYQRQLKAKAVGGR